MYRKILLFASVFIFSITAFSSSASATSTPLSSLATTTSTINEPLWSQNDIIFYQPQCSSSGGSGCCSVELPATMTDEDERQRTLIDACADFAISLQITYGVPWELVFAQMSQESNTGIAYINSIYDENNYLGLTYANKQLYSLEGANAHGFARYQTIADSIASFVVDFRRNGAYDDGLPYTSGSNFNYIQYFMSTIESYCPALGGCDHNNYQSTIMKRTEFIDEYAKSKGIQTSEEVAKQNNLQAGGQYPDGGDVKDKLNAENHSLHADCSGSGTGTGTTGTGTSGSSAVTWQDGWITEGMDGFVKEDAVELKGSALKDDKHTKSYTTSNGKPNKILLHYTEGTTSGLAAYGSNLYPAHFTIDLRNKTVSQHFPIDKPSDATVAGDLGGAVQIEIVGYGFDKDGNCVDVGNDSEWCFKNYSDEDWDYLAKLLYAIKQWGDDNDSEIPLTTSVDWDLKADDSQRLSSVEEYTNTTGIVAHMHSPAGDDHTDTGNIWSLVEAAIKRYSGIDSCGNTTGGDLTTYVKRYVWPQYKDDDIPTDDYATDAKANAEAGLYTGSNGFTHTQYYGIDCGGFVTTIIHNSKYDESYNYDATGGNTSSQIKWAKENWEQVTDTSTLQPGDVAFKSDTSDGGGHTWLFIGDIDGYETNIGSASWGTRAPCAGKEGVSGVWFHKKS